MEIIVNGIKYELRPEQGGAYVIEMTTVATSLSLQR